jgi:hypothetical protein
MSDAPTPTINPLNTKEACQYLWVEHHYKISPKTLEHNRSTGEGFNPKYFHNGRKVFYWPKDLDEAIQSQTTGPVHNTSEGRQARQALKDRSRNPKLDPTD